MQSAGLKVSQVKACTIAQKANDYLDRHRDELLAQAVMTIDAVPSLRKLAEAEAQQRRHSANIRTAAQRAMI